MGKTRVNLTKRHIDSLSYQGDGNERDVSWDEAIPGFGVRVYPTGKKAFVLYYRTREGRQRLMTLGKYGPMTLDQARERARKHLVMVTDGEDPLAEKKSAAKGETIGQLCQVYLERHASLKKSGDEDRRRLERTVMPQWGAIKIASLHRSEVSELHHAIGERAPYEANRTLALVRKMFELAKTWGMLDINAQNPAQGVSKFRERKRDRWVRPEELPRLAEAIDKLGNIYTRASFWLYLLTGARKTELLAAKWTDIDTARNELRIDDTKAGRTHYIPLSNAALSILHDIPRLEGNPYIFPGEKEGQHLVNIDKSWRVIRKAAGVEDVRLHDLRRTVGSWLATNGASLPLIGKVLNHSTPSTTAVYARLGEDPARQALEEHGKRIIEAAKGVRVLK